MNCFANGCGILSQCGSGALALAQPLVKHFFDDAGRYGCGAPRRAFALLLGVLLSVGCSGGSERPSNQLEPEQTITVSALHGQASGQVSVDGHTLVEGENAFLVELSPSGADLAQASALMPAHGHGSPTAAVISRTTTGYRVSNLVFSMPGLWNVLLDVDIAGQRDRIEFSVDIP
jgi:hypothetical protein